MKLEVFLRDGNRNVKTYYSSIFDVVKIADGGAHRIELAIGEMASTVYSYLISSTGIPMVGLPGAEASAAEPEEMILLGTLKKELTDLGVSIANEGSAVTCQLRYAVDGARDAMSLQIAVYEAAELKRELEHEVAEVSDPVLAFESLAAKLSTSPQSLPAKAVETVRIHSWDVDQGLKDLAAEIASDARERHAAKAIAIRRVRADQPLDSIAGRWVSLQLKQHLETLGCLTRADEGLTADGELFCDGAFNVVLRLVLTRDHQREPIDRAYDLVLKGADSLERLGVREQQAPPR